MTSHQKNFKGIILCFVFILSAFCLFGCGNSENDEPNALEDMALVDVIDSIYGIVPVDLGLFTDSLDTTDSEMMPFYTGLTDLSHVKEAAFSEPMISSQAYSMVIVRVDDEANTADVAAAMKAGINPRKWVCVEADDLQVVSYRDVVLLFMVSSTLSDVVTSQDVVDAFKQICGSDVTIY